MKNPDGSTFKGTPEQFVQQNSENFKKAYPNGNELTYRGVLKNNKNLSEYGDNIDNTVFTANRELANIYGNRTDDPLRPLIKNKNDKTGVYELYSKNSNNQLYLDALGDGWTSIDLSDIDYKKSILKHSIQQQKENLPRFLDNKKVYDIMQNRLTADLDRFKRIDNIIDDRIKIRNDLRNNNDLNKFVDIKDETWTDGLAKYIKDKNINKIKINDINDGGYGTVIINNQKPGNYLKSAIGNNGMFDITNPNIYKGLIPAAGLYGLTQSKKQGGKLIPKGQQGLIFNKNPNYIEPFNQSKSNFLNLNKPKVFNSSSLLNMGNYTKHRNIIDKYLQRNIFKGTKLTTDDLYIPFSNFINENPNINPDDLLKLMLAQGQAETHLGKDVIRGKQGHINPFNMGEYDKKTAFTYSSPQESITSYLNTLKKDYFPRVNNKPLELLKPNNYVNNQNKRYASNSNYEKDLNSTIEYITKNYF